MTHRDSGWQPDADANQYKGENVTDHAVAPGEINDGEREPDIDVVDTDDADDADE